MKSRLAEIDALRGLAAVVVAFIFHQHYLTGQFQSGPLDGLPVFTWLHKNGWVAVDLFFVISGYIFAYIYVDRKAEHLSGNQFFWARFARLYPLHLVTLVICGAILAIGKPASAQYVNDGLWNFALNLLMLQETGLQDGKSFNVPSWSISVEVMCYVVFYFTVSRLPKQIYKVAGALAVLGLLATIGSDPTVDHIGRGFCGFFAGVVLHGGRNAPRARILTICLACAVTVLLIPAASAGAKLGFALFPAIVGFASYLSFLRHGILTWLGDRSYSIYMWHIPIYMALNVAVFGSKPIPADLVWPAIIFSWAAILIISDLSFRFIESPARVWLKSVPARSGTPAPDTPPTEVAQVAPRS